MTLDRRQFLSAATAGAALTLVAARGLGDHAADADGLAHPELLTALGAGTVREIGRAYRELVPTESDREALEAVLRAAASSVEEAVRADCEAGRVVVVRGWMLSVTEARQCALFSLRG
jgi:hypothetical protein